MFVRTLLCTVLIGLIALNYAEAAMTREQMEKTAKGIRSSCISKTGADLALVEGIRRGEFADDPKLHCYTQCIMKTMRTFKNGHVELDMMLKQIDAMMPADISPRIIDAAKKCNAEVTDEEGCLLSFNFVKCTYNKDKEVFFFP